MEPEADLSDDELLALMDLFDLGWPDDDLPVVPNTENTLPKPTELW